MRNSSDIFFLNNNESNDKELWSVNGSCPMKIRRRPNTVQNECFEYGRGHPDTTSGDSKTEKSDLKNLNAPQEVPVTPNTPIPTRPGTSSNIECRPQKAHIEKIGDRQMPEGISSSSIARNPITGSGMDIHSCK